MNSNGKKPKDKYKVKLVADVGALSRGEFRDNLEHLKFENDDNPLFQISWCENKSLLHSKFYITAKGSYENLMHFEEVLVGWSQ